MSPYAYSVKVFLSKYVYYIFVIETEMIWVLIASRLITDKIFFLTSMFRILWFLVKTTNGCLKTQQKRTWIDYPWITSSMKLIGFFSSLTKPVVDTYVLNSTLLYYIVCISYTYIRRVLYWNRSITSKRELPPSLAYRIFINMIYFLVHTNII